MATSLSSQLLHLATPQTSILEHKRDRRSILFDTSEAAKFGRDVYYDIGWSGYEVLATTDSAFRPFASSLFGRTSRDFQRAVETREVNAKLDLEIDRFLLLLSLYLEKEASLRALEWLVYRYQINEMNQQSLLKCIFPYYESPLFTRILQVVALGGEGGEWHWLTGCQKGGRPLPKRTVFMRWANSQAFRNFLADFLKSMIKAHPAHRTPSMVASFYISTVLGGLGMTEIREEHLSSIVKSLPHCLASGQEQLLTGCYLLLANLSSKTHLSPTLTTSLMDTLIQKHQPPPALMEQCLLCLLVLAHHQPVEELASMTAVALSSSPLLGGLAPVAKERSVAALLSPYIMGYVRYIVGGEGEAHGREEKKIIVKFTKFVDEVFSLPLSDSDAVKVMWALFEALRTHITALQSVPSLLAAVGTAVRAVEALQPHGYAEATSRLAHQQDDPKLGSQYKKVLQSLLISDSGSSACFTQLLHPQNALREEASKTYLKKLGKEKEAGASTALHVRSMLSDDHPAIPLMALSTPAALTALPASILAEQCCQLLSKRGKEWQKVRVASLEALSGSVAACFDDTTKHLVLSTCLPCVLLPSTFGDLALAKILLQSKLAEQTAFLSALKREAASYLHSAGSAKDYTNKIWSAMPRVVSGLGGIELLSLCGMSESNTEAQVIALALLHASLSTQGVKGCLAVKTGHKLIDLCLTLLEGGKAPTEPPAPPKNKGSQGDTQPLSPDQLRACLAQARHGYLPCHLLTACVLRVCAAFTLPPACQHTPYWTPLMETEPDEGHLLLLIKVMKAALRMETSGNTPGRDAVLVAVFKECLPEPKSRLCFLAVIWGWHTSLPFTDIIDEALQAWTLVLAKALLTSPATQSSSLAWTLSTHQPLVPALLSALTSQEERVRKEAIECLRALVVVRGGALAADSYVEVIRIVLKQAEELVADASQLAALLDGGGSSVCQGRQVTECLLGVVVRTGPPVLPHHLCAVLLYALTAATDAATLIRLLPLAETLLNKVEKTTQSKEEQRHGKEGRLDVSSSLCLLYILQRYTPETAEVLETKAGLRVFERAMDNATACLEVHDSLVAPQSVLLQQVLSSKFMASIKKEVTVSKIWAMLVTCLTSSRHPQEAGHLRHALRYVTLDAEVIVREMNNLELTPKATTSLQAAKSKRMKMKEANVTHQGAWEKLQLMIETLTVMKGLQRPWLLVPPLIHWLSLTLTLDLTSTTLLQQQILSTLLHLLEKSVEELPEEEVSQRVQVNVEVIVACVRASLSHDTHRRALLVLGLCARIAPDAVLHNMMAIFTFMGTSLLRRDDAYSFEVIHRTIESIVPTLVQRQHKHKGLSEGAGVDAGLAQVCQVFVDALPDLPHHRRLPLFTQLASTIQPNPNLWLLLALLANSHVMRGGSRGYKGVGHGGREGDQREDEEEEERGALPQVIQFSLTLAAQFPATAQVLACVRLMRLVATLPDDKETTKALHEQQQQQQQPVLQLKGLQHHRKEKEGNRKEKKQQKHHIENKEERVPEKQEVTVMEEAQFIFLSFGQSPRHTFHLKYTVTGLVAHLLTSDKFIGKVFEAEEQVQEVKELQALCHQLLEVTLCLLHDVNFACDLHKDKSTATGRFFTSLQRKVVEVVERLVALLPPSSLLQVCQALFSSPVPLVRCRAAELISAKLQPHLNYFRGEDTQELQSTLQTLCLSVANKEEPVENRQTFLYCLQLLTRHLAHHTPPVSSLQPVLATAVRVVCDEGEEPRVVTQGLLVAAEAVAALQAAAVGCLGQLMPTLIRMLAASTTSATVPEAATSVSTTTTDPAANTQLLATLTALHKVIDSLPQLLSPYLAEVIKQVCCIRTPEGASKTAVVGKESRVVTRVLAIRESLIKKVEPRILVPRLEKAFHSLLGVRTEDLAPLHALVVMVGCLLEEFRPKTLPPHIPSLLALLTKALDLRNLKGDSTGVQLVEEAVFSALSRLLLHLPEQDNISIFTSLISWAGFPSTTPTDMPPAPARLISFYRFTEHLVGTYQVLFVAAHLAETLLQPTVALLTRLSDVTATPVFGEGTAAEGQTCQLLEAILSTLQKVFTHDSVGFTTPDRFDLLSTPLIDLLDNEVGGSDLYKRRVHTHLSPCLTRLAVAGADDSLWRGLAGQVLRRLRVEDRPQVVLGALEVFQGLVETLGEDFLRPLLADAIPPISEALESTNQEVETATRTLFSKMEDILGDQLRSYLNY